MFLKILLEFVPTISNGLYVVLRYTSFDNYVIRPLDPAFIICQSITLHHLLLKAKAPRLKKPGDVIIEKIYWR